MTKSDCFIIFLLITILGLLIFLFISLRQFLTVTVRSLPYFTFGTIQAIQNDSFDVLSRNKTKLLHVLLTPKTKISFQTSTQPAITKISKADLKVNDYINISTTDNPNTNKTVTAETIQVVLIIDPAPSP